MLRKRTLEILTRTRGFEYLEPLIYTNSGTAINGAYVAHFFMAYNAHKYDIRTLILDSQIAMEIGRCEDGTIYVCRFINNGKAQKFNVEIANFLDNYINREQLKKLMYGNRSFEEYLFEMPIREAGVFYGY